MTESEFHEQKARIEGLLNGLIEATRMDEWTIRVTYRNEDPDSDSDDWEELARVSVKWQYREAALNIFVPPMSRNSDAEIQSHLIHELMHIVVSELREWQDADDGNTHSIRRAKDHEERVVTSLTRLVRSACLHAQEDRWKCLRIEDPAKNLGGEETPSATETN